MHADERVKVKANWCRRWLHVEHARGALDVTAVLARSEPRFEHECTGVVPIAIDIAEFDGIAEGIAGIAHILARGLQRGQWHPHEM
jgi:hypothetical protein